MEHWRCLSQEPTFGGHLLVQTEDGSLPWNEINGEVVRIDCSKLLKPWHIYGLIAEGLHLTVDRGESLTLTDIYALAAAFSQSHHLSTVTVMLERIDCSFGTFDERTSVLWSLLNFALIMPDCRIRLKIILGSTMSGIDSQWAFTTTAWPIQIDLRPQSPTTEAGLIETYLTQHITQLKESSQWTNAELEAIIQQTYRLFRDYIGGLADLHQAAQFLLATYNQVIQTAGAAPSDLPTLFKLSREAISKQLRGEAARHITGIMVKYLTEEERYLLIAAYLASHNPAKYDLRIFGNNNNNKRPRSVMTKKRGRKSKKNPAHEEGEHEPDGQPYHYHSSSSTAATSTDRGAPKLFPLDRLLAIFYFIYRISDNAPPLIQITKAIEGLVARGLLQQITVYSKLEMPRYRCLSSLDMAILIATSLNFDLHHYLYSQTS